MKKRALLICWIVFFLLSVAVIFIAGWVNAGDWNSDPDNWSNSEMNWENSSNNWDNSPDNWANSPDKWGNDRIIYDSDGDPAGYRVPKDDGGENIFDFDGNRKAYIPGD